MSLRDACPAPLLVAAALACAACSPSAGEDGTTIMAPYGALSGGMVFATSHYRGNDGYDLMWVPVAGLSQISTPVAPVRLTNASGNEWQPSVSAGNNGIVFVREGDGIHLISPSGRVSRVSNPGDRYHDSIPAISPDGALVAWVREDTLKPIGNSGFNETVVMIANFDGKNARAVSPKPGIIQDAPTFSPDPRSHQLAWSEFNATTIGPAGPVDYGIWVHDYTTSAGRFACTSPAIPLPDGGVYRCFGQHLTWPQPNVIVADQQLLEIPLDGAPLDAVPYNKLVASLMGQQTGTPALTPIPGVRPGFFDGFPLSASFDLNRSRMVVDGVVGPTGVDSTTLAFILANVDGSGGAQILISGYSADYDPVATGNYLFSVATPQLIP